MPVFNDFDFQIALARRRGANFVDILDRRSFATPVFRSYLCELSTRQNYGKTQHFAQFLPAKASLLSNIDAARPTGNFQYSRKLELLNFLWSKAPKYCLHRVQAFARPTSSNKVLKLEHLTTGRGSNYPLPVAPVGVEAWGPVEDVPLPHHGRRFGPRQARGMATLENPVLSAKLSHWLDLVMYWMFPGRQSCHVVLATIIPSHLSWWKRLWRSGDWWPGQCWGSQRGFLCEICRLRNLVVSFHKPYNSIWMFTRPWLREGNDILHRLVRELLQRLKRVRQWLLAGGTVRLYEGLRIVKNRTYHRVKAFPTSKPTFHEMFPWNASRRRSGSGPSLRLRGLGGRRRFVSCRSALEIDCGIFAQKLVTTFQSHQLSSAFDCRPRLCPG